MSFGLGFSMPHLTKVAGAAGVVPMTIVGTSPYVAQTVSDFIDGGALTFAAATTGDVIIVAYSDDTGLAPSWGTPSGFSAPTQVGVVGTAGTLGIWYIFQFKATGTSASTSISPTLGGLAVGYSFSAGWLVRGANAVTPFENVACAAYTLGTPGSFSVTTAAANDCVLGVAYATPVPTATSLDQMDAFTPITSGWTAQGPSLDGGGNQMFFTVSNTNVATSGTKTISVTSTSTSAAAAILTINLKK